MQTKWQADRIISQWESRRLCPPEDRPHPLCKCCGNPISDDELYNIRGGYYDEDCAKEMCREYVIDEAWTCEGCDETLDEMFFLVGDDCYCETCFEDYFRE